MAMARLAARDAGLVPVAVRATPSIVNSILFATAVQTFALLPVPGVTPVRLLVEKVSFVVTVSSKGDVLPLLCVTVIVLPFRFTFISRDCPAASAVNVRPVTVFCGTPAVSFEADDKPKRTASLLLRGTGPIPLNVPPATDKVMVSWLFAFVTVAVIKLSSPSDVDTTTVPFALKEPDGV